MSAEALYVFLPSGMKEKVALDLPSYMGAPPTTTF